MKRPPGRPLDTIDGDVLSIALRCILRDLPAPVDGVEPEAPEEVPDDLTPPPAATGAAGTVP